MSAYVAALLHSLYAEISFPDMEVMDVVVMLEVEEPAQVQIEFVEFIGIHELT